MHTGDFRLPKYCKRYEYVSFNLDNPIPVVQGAGYQQKNGYRFSVDSSSDINPLDWHNAYFEIDFHVSRNVDPAVALTAADEVGVLNGSHSLVNKLSVNFGGVNVLDSQDANQAIHVKNIVDYSKGYADSIGQSMFYYPDTSDQAISTKFQTVAQVAAGVAVPAHTPTRTVGYNDGFAKRKT